MIGDLQAACSRRGRIDAFLAMDVLAAANARQAAGAPVLHLEVGEPAGGAPPEALQTAQAALANAHLGYLDARGLPDLRRRIARLYLEWYGLAIDADHVVVTSGASAGFVLAFLAAFDHGQRVALADPGYPCYRNTLAALGITPVRIATAIEDGFQPTIAQLEALDGPLHGLILASPANPTGSLIGAGRMAELTGYCEARGIRIVSDEIYHGLTYQTVATSALQHSAQAIVVNSFSKFFGMTGWRVGWLVLPDSLIRNVEKLAQNLYISTSAIGQHAALGAFAAEARMRQRITTYARNRQCLLDGLRQAGIERLAPADGAFYVYADVGQLTDDSVAFCRAALEATDVAFTPGVDFDPARGQRFVRFSFAADEAVIREAVERLVPWLQSLARRTEAL